MKRIGIWLALALVFIVAVPAEASDVSGPATWYGTGPGAGHAAAGPALRVGNWRGRHVRVCHSGSCVVVVLDDWCACGGGRVIDLSEEDFSKLAPLSAGVIHVTVTYTSQKPAQPAQPAPRGPHPTSPPTDAEVIRDSFAG